MPAKIGAAPVVGLFAFRREETAGNGSLITVIPHAFTAQTFFGTVIRARAIFQITFSCTFHITSK